MIHSLKKTVCALAVLATTSSAVVAQSIDVKVIGTITPTACTPNFSGGGTIDYGRIAPATLKKDAYTVLEERSIDFSVTCDAPVKLAIKAVDGRKNSTAGSDAGANDFALDPTKKLFGFSTAGIAGLGLDGSKKIGGYALRLATGTMKADGTNVDGLWTTDGTTTNWTGPVSLGTLFNNGKAPYNTWAAKGTKMPVAFTTLTGKLNAQAYINKSSELDLSKEIKLDGLTTLELVYL